MISLKIFVEKFPYNFSKFNRNLQKWCIGRSVVIRLPLLVYLAYVGFMHLQNSYYSAWIEGWTFRLHEYAHSVFSPFGQVISIVVANYVLIAVLILIAKFLYANCDYFAFSVVGCLISFSLLNVATYIGDAQVQALPLLNIGPNDAYHDWNYLLVKVGMLEHCALIAVITKFIGLFVWMVSIWLGIRICYLIMSSDEFIKNSSGS